MLALDVGELSRSAQDEVHAAIGAGGGLGYLEALSTVCLGDPALEVTPGQLSYGLQALVRTEELVAPATIRLSR
jgi:hypothetical protein